MTLVTTADSNGGWRGERKLRPHQERKISEKIQIFIKLRRTNLIAINNLQNDIIPIILLTPISPVLLVAELERKRNLVTL